MKFQTEFYKKLTEDKKSSFEKYREIIVGSKKWSYFLYYELTNLLVSSLGSSIGLLGRRLLYPRLLASAGKNLFFGRNVILRCAGKIYMGSNVIIDDNCLLDGRGPNEINLWIGNDVFIGRDTLISCHDGVINIGNNVNIGVRGMIFSGSRVEIGNNVIIAADCYITGSTKQFNRLDIPIISQGSKAEGVSIGDNTWIGARVIVNDGVNIGRDCIIGAGSVVIEDIPDFYIAYGVPAKPMRKRE